MPKLVRRCIELFLISLVFTISRTADARTLTQLIADSRTLAKDSASATRQRFSDTDITNWLNQGQRDAASRTKCLNKSTVFVLATGTTYYAMPSDFVFANRVTRGNLSLTELSPEALDGRSRGWETATGLPTYYFVNFASRTLMGFAPFPATTADTDTIKVDYTSQTADLVAGTDLPWNGLTDLTDYHQALPYYAAARMTAVDGRVTIAQIYASIYEATLKVMTDNCGARPNYRPGAVGVP